MLSLYVILKISLSSLAIFKFPVKDDNKCYIFYSLKIDGLVFFKISVFNFPFRRDPYTFNSSAMICLCDWIRYLTFPLWVFYFLMRVFVWLSYASLLLSAQWQHCSWLCFSHSFHVTVNSFVDVITFTENFILALTGFYANLKHNQGPVLVS